MEITHKIALCFQFIEIFGIKIKSVIYVRIVIFHWIIFIMKCAVKANILNPHHFEPSRAAIIKIIQWCKSRTVLLLIMASSCVCERHLQ